MTELNTGNSNFSLAGKVSVITGGGSGIGRAIALRFAAAGSSVRILDLNLSEAEQVVQEITQRGGSASAFSCDVTEQSAVRQTFEKMLQSSRVHILVNNAGISHIGTVETTSEAEFDRIMRVNVKGSYN